MCPRYALRPHTSLNRKQSQFGIRITPGGRWSLQRPAATHITRRHRWLSTNNESVSSPPHPPARLTHPFSLYRSICAQTHTHTQTHSRSERERERLPTPDCYGKLTSAQRWMGLGGKTKTMPAIINNKRQKEKNSNTRSSLNSVYGSQLCFKIV